MEKSVVVQAPINIALIKYWGKRNEELIIPYNDSISLSVDKLYAKTKILVTDRLTNDSVSINGVEIDLKKSRRFPTVFKEFRRLAFGHENGPPFVSINSTTNFTTSSGLASSAAGFAAIAYGLGQIGQLNDQAIVKLARIGSGSACRSVLSGFVHWIAGDRLDSDEETTCKTVESSADWSYLRAIIFEFKNSSKEVSSTDGMQRTAKTSTLFAHRVENVVPERVERLTNAIKTGNFEELAEITMADSNQLHAICLDSQPPLMYLNDNSRRLIDFIVSYNQQKGSTIAAYTFDAGPNCCVFIADSNVNEFLTAFNGAFSNDANFNGMTNGDADYSNYTLPLKNIFVSSMNADSYPEELDGNFDLQSGHAIICKFNRLGTLVAVGSNDGRIFLFDFITRGLVKSWGAHVKPVSSLSWSRSGRFLMTASADSTVAIWNVLDTSIYVDRFHYGACVNPPEALFNPKNEDQFLVLTISTSTPNVRSAVLRNIGAGDETKLGTELCQQQADEFITAVTFDHQGNYVFLGTTKGQILLYDTKTKKHFKTVSQSVSHQIRNFFVTRRGGYIMTNSFDSIVRCYRYEQFVNKSLSDGDTIEPIQKFQDMVNKTKWKLVCGSNEGDFVCGASAKSHSLHLWERDSGNLIKILHGAKGELLNDVQWHPTRPVILSVANGIVSIWTQAHVENWSAFAPDFVELEENRKYEEHEPEFDTYDEDNEEEVQISEIDEENEIDVVGLNASDFGSSDEDDGTAKNLVWFLPITSEMEAAEDPIFYKPHVSS